jgi:hypothetical protein
MSIDLGLACLSVLVEPAQRYGILDPGFWVTTGQFPAAIIASGDLFSRAKRVSSIEHPATSIKHHGAKVP